MTRRAALVAGLVFALAGCGHTPTPKADPVDVAGVFQTADGKPVQNVTVTFIPLTSGGLQGGATLKADGKFAIKLVPGKYGFYFEGQPAGLKAVPAGYQSASEKHTFEVPATGKSDLSIKLDAG